jgi:hypothetical protein
LCSASQIGVSIRANRVSVMGCATVSAEGKPRLPCQRTDGPSVIYSGRSFFFITPEMRCLDVVRVIISPSSVHSFRIPVVGNHIVIVCELFMTNGAFPVLLDDLPVQQFPHFRAGPEFPISSRVMRILNAPHAHPYYCGFAFLSDRFPATAE